MPDRIFSGIQPSGEIHIGNYLGAIQNWVALIKKYEAIFCVVDYHAMTVEYEPAVMRERVFNAALVNMACGLDPAACTLFVQSQVPEHTELTWILNCVTPIGELERMTQFKDKSRQHRKNVNVGLLDYPVLMAADILIYRANLVPVGEDQIQHLELAREVARKFNAAFGETFPEPQPLLTKAKRIMGLDGKSKMSKSLNNYIGVLEDEKSVWTKLAPAFTDENRKKRSDPGDPSICNIYTLHQSFSTPEELQRINTECRSAQIGCVDCKKLLHRNLTAHLAPIQERAAHLRQHPDLVRDALNQGAAKCREIAKQVMDEVRTKTGLR
jgi:tryptophanyl-tRNA synthetase